MGIAAFMMANEPAGNNILVFRRGPDGSLQTITKSVGDDGMAAWWIVRDGHVVFAADAASNTISSLSVLRRGELQLFESVAGKARSGTAPIDMAVMRDGRFLYVIGSGNGSVTGLEVQDGSLNEVTSVSGLPVKHSRNRGTLT
jgi:hypothetical protein